MDSADTGQPKPETPPASAASTRGGAQPRPNGRQNIAAAVLLIMLLVAGLLLFWAIDARRRVELCVESGRRDCLPVSAL